MPTKLLPSLDLSIIIPAHNEAGNLQDLCRQIFVEVKKITSKFEVIIIDDGSTDNSWEILKKIKSKQPLLKAFSLRRQSGQTAALMTGFSHAQGKIIITLDADLQHDPKDIPNLLKALTPGIDVVSGHRDITQRPLINRFISQVEQFLIHLILGIKVKDSSISPNAYRREVFQDINLFGEMHRYLIPIILWRGFKVKSIPVVINQRQIGTSNYKTSKAIKGFLDLFIVKFWQDYSTRPIHFFGSIGLVLMFIGGGIGLEEAVKKLIFKISIINSNLPLLAAFLTIVGIQFFIFGILADIMIRTYYKDKSNYQIKARI